MTTRLTAQQGENALDTRGARAAERSLGARKFIALGQLLLGLVIIAGLAACAPAKPSSEKAIVGQWTNPQGGVIHFYADSTGFMPGDETQTPEIPSVKFTYYFQDESHLGIKMGGQDAVVVEVKLEGDKMTWFNRANGVQFVYTRAK